jgi:hypothetical protein
MKPRPKREDVISALQTLVDADAISQRHAFDIAFDAAMVVGIETGEERERAKGRATLQIQDLNRLGGMGVKP